ncbi:MAG: HAMP domain-containing sensor histidine kinase [Alphaproteobacteria bacterium]
MLFIVGGGSTATLAYNVIGRAIGFENVSVLSLIPGFCVGSLSAFVISFLVIRSRRLLLGRLAAEQKIASDLKLEIIERKRIEAELQIAKHEAELANRAKSEFLANMSHELRTPLNAVIGFSDAILGQTCGPVGNDKYLEFVTDIHHAGKQLLVIINDILDLSRIEAGKAELRESEQSLSRMVESCLARVKARAAERGLTLDLDLASGPPAIYADGQKIKQILVNLLSNSIKFTPAGGTVTIRCRHDPSGCLLQVIDTGVGMAKADVPLALSMFRQIEGSPSRRFNGIGLGLPLCKALAEMHGGSLEIKSEVGKGTTVTLRLPVERIIRPKAADQVPIAALRTDDRDGLVARAAGAT